MKIIKTRMRNRIEDEFLPNNLVINIENEIANNFDSDLIIDEFKYLKERRILL